MKRKSIILAFAMLPVIVAAAATLYVEPLRWRVQVMALVALGKVPDLTVVDAFRMMQPGSLFFLGGLAESHNAYSSIVNPYVSTFDVKQGGLDFRANCAGCHGADARGREIAPTLVNRQLTHGDSDWAVYQTILHGIPGTAMAPHRLDPRTIWQIIAYLRSLNFVAISPEGSPNDDSTAAVRLDATELESLKDAGDDWLSYSGSLLGTRHSRLSQISRGNVRRLAPRWMYQFDEPGDPLEVSAIERNGVIFITSATRVVALNSTTGTQLWKFSRDAPPTATACCGNVNRGVALLDDRVFIGTLDAHLIALSARTGRKLWETSVADYRQGYSITSAPIAYKDLVVTGVSGGDYPTRGLLAAFDVTTGKERWRFWAIPGPGQPGHETWAGESWKVGGGSTWMTGSYDSTLDMLYWGVGNPAPVYNASTRRGDDLYTNSVVALRGTSGELIWHFQFTPADDHDWDSAQIPVLVDRPEAAHSRQLLWANRNGFFYVLDRVTGEYLHASPFVNQTWAEGLDPKGRPILKPNIAPSPQGTYLYPSTTGGSSWWSPTYEPRLDLMIIPALERSGIYFSGPVPPAKAQELFMGSAHSGVTATPHYSTVVALNPRDGSVAWQYRRSQKTAEASYMSGLLSTDGGLVFATGDNSLEALDSTNGQLLWSFSAGARIGAAPVTYSVAGTQYVSIPSGRAFLAFALVGEESERGPSIEPHGAGQQKH
jgi:alcohol dehydrogenase (cytochrome c)